MPVYDKLGVRFQYPDNWRLDESETDEAQPSVSVYSPGGAFWSVIVHPAAAQPRELVSAACAVMAAEYDELDVEDFEETLAGHAVAGTGLNFYCLDITNTAVVRGIRTPAATLLVFCQADDREYEQVGPIFDAMTHSLFASPTTDQPRTSATG